MSISRRDVFYLRGRLVRTLAELAGSANPDAYFAALCDTAEFNRANPMIAIPAAARALGHNNLAVCADCIGEGSRNLAVGASISPSGPIIANFEERICMTCEGSGFRGVSGFGANAVRSGGHEARSA
jgi:hypothetical protein